jgi:hypothetical protein
MYKKGDASMVATVLLIMSAIVAGALVTSFSQKSTKQVSEKIVEIGTSADCADIRLSLSEKSDKFVVKNRGTLGIDSIVLRKYQSTGDVETQNIETFGANEKLLPGTASEHELGPTSDFFPTYTRVEAKPLFVNEVGDLIGCNEVGYEQ